MRKVILIDFGQKSTKHKCLNQIQVFKKREPISRNYISNTVCFSESITLSISVEQYIKKVINKANCTFKRNPLKHCIKLLG